MRIAPWDDDEPYQLNVWVESTKSQPEFERVLTSAIEPLEVRDRRFSFLDVHCTVHAIGDEQPPTFPGVPAARYSFRIDVPTKSWDFSGLFDRILPFAVASGANR